ncbi:hypothetical protein K457DRAFT_443599 [Linnemannia elongata AG-77]|uniref:Uncharacterized protein n=1 Tax=Linnemannia elongata AG-77 TaxID=1314771 RepID=A0A197JYS8_9FUNG|nr:hypothetical protein K457DRAFT_443599 [Linnemannia elongata AG-77]
MLHHTLHLTLPHHNTSLDKHNKNLITLSLLRRHTIPSPSTPLFYPSSAASSSSSSSSSFVLIPFLLIIPLCLFPPSFLAITFHSVSCFPILLHLTSLYLCPPF